VPPNERVRLHDGQQLTPFDQPRQRDQRDPCRIVSTARLRLPFQVQRQLLSQEQVLRGELGM